MNQTPGLYAGPGIYPKFYGKWIWILTTLQLRLSGVHYTNSNTKCIHHVWECVLYYGNEMKVKDEINLRQKWSKHRRWICGSTSTHKRLSCAKYTVYSTWSKLKNQQGNCKHQTLPPVLRTGELLWAYTVLAAVGNPCCPLGSHFEHTHYWRRHCLANYGQTWRRPNTRNWIVIRRGQYDSNRWHVPKIWWNLDMWLLRCKQTHTHTDTLIPILHTPTGGGGRKEWSNNQKTIKIDLTGKQQFAFCLNGCQRGLGSITGAVR